jgi:uncharacterized membrane protein
MLILDFIYIYNIKDTFSKQILNMKFRIVGAIACYFLLVIGLNHFIINKNESIMNAFILGLVIYGVYDTTNYATIETWTIKFTLIDTLWGGILMALTTKIVYLLS